MVIDLRSVLFWQKQILLKKEINLFEVSNVYETKDSDTILFIAKTNVCMDMNKAVLYIFGVFVIPLICSPHEIFMSNIVFQTYRSINVINKKRQ